MHDDGVSRFEGLKFQIFIHLTLATFNGQYIQAEAVAKSDVREGLVLIGAAGLQA